MSAFSLLKKEEEEEDLHEFSPSCVPKIDAII
jgi:hypothetical protein